MANPNDRSDLQEILQLNSLGTSISDDAFFERTWIRLDSSTNPKELLVFLKEALVGSLGFEPRISSAPGWDP